tara:strand:- start:23901 stop:24746 length:846 start_codon:yes stop_codon:yes gene_type:complete
MRELEQKQGWMINGGNSEQYYKMAAASAMMLKIHQSLPVAVCIDKVDNWPTEFEDCVDYVVEYPFGDTSHNMPQNVQLNQWQFYHVTPFHETIVIESDTLVLNDVSYIEDILEHNDLLFPTEITDFRNVPYVPPHVVFFKESRLEKVHAGIWTFKQGTEAMQYFKMLDVVSQHWRDAFKEYFKPEHVPDTPILDVLHSISATMIGEHENITVHDPLLLRYTHMLSSPDDKWNDHMNVWYTDNFKIDNYRQNGIIKYSEPDVLSERILDGIRKNYRNSNRSD